VPHFVVHEHRFTNGLLLLTLEDHSAPIVTFQAFFAVGSADERSDATGSASFLEHLMFDGPAKYGPKELDRRLKQASGTSNAVTTACWSGKPSSGNPGLGHRYTDHSGVSAGSSASLSTRRRTYDGSGRRHASPVSLSLCPSSNPT
jgi:hypothetical protein